MSPKLNKPVKMRMESTAAGTTVGKYCLFCANDSVQASPSVSTCLIPSTSSSSKLLKKSTDPVTITRQKRATQKIFQELLIPEKCFKDVTEADGVNYCLSCLNIVKDIEELIHQTEIFQLKIKAKTEEIGKLIKDALASPPPRIGTKKSNLGPAQRRTALVCDNFKKLVVRNYIEGLLPNPSVHLSLNLGAVGQSNISPTICTLRQTSSAIPLKSKTRPKVHQTYKKGNLHKTTKPTIIDKRTSRRKNIRGKNTDTAISEPRVALERLDIQQLALSQVTNTKARGSRKITRVKRCRTGNHQMSGKKLNSTSFIGGKAKLAKLPVVGKKIKTDPNNNSSSSLVEPKRRQCRPMPKSKADQLQRKRQTKTFKTKGRPLKRNIESDDEDLFTPVVPIKVMKKTSKKPLKPWNVDEDKVKRKHYALPELSNTESSESLKPPDEVEPNGDAESGSIESEGYIDEDLPEEEDDDKRDEVIELWVQACIIPRNPRRYYHEMQDMMEPNEMDRGPLIPLGHVDVHVDYDGNIACRICGYFVIDQEFEAVPTASRRIVEMERLSCHIAEMHSEPEDVKPFAHQLDTEEPIKSNHILVHNVLKDSSPSRRKKAESTITASIQRPMLQSASGLGSQNDERSRSPCDVSFSEGGNKCSDTAEANNRCTKKTDQTDVHNNSACPNEIEDTIIGMEEDAWMDFSSAIINQNDDEEEDENVDRVFQNSINQFYLTETTETISPENHMNRFLVNDVPFSGQYNEFEASNSKDVPSTTYS